ncbi:Gfo/Idh/MocA family protein [Poritiphilus flavus]|uniref:Gfo/Idh/MocA family oxidoreductase n=1 Tax=Poritiphilus flavus TaxID=2697053 RepID=A0A6L9E767_9FLAO|nr:Gfo/Idh/MocA family oxidoreductase [Poritiphilus flavus]NAS10625.1 Gfo/Idh/MocA family oxidoreductase [Poritiphilus flavus]
MEKLKFAIFGTGFWANFQIPGWQELEGVQCVAAYNRTRSKAEKLAQTFGIPAIYDSPEALIANEDLDFVDICTNAETHLPLAKMAAEHGLDIVCQKPMAPSLLESQELVSICSAQGVKFFINENFRWQAPIRKLKEVMDSGVIGTAFKARVSFCSAFPVFDNQPFLAELDHFILTDIGSHVLDVCRFLFGEAQSLYCTTRRINKNIRGEDVANVLMKMQNQMTCFAEMSYASKLEKESFPQVLVSVEGSRGSLALTHDYTLKTTTSGGTVSEVIRPKVYPWADPEYAVVHSSIVDCQRDILKGLKGGEAETTGADNLKTVELVWKSYESAEEDMLIRLD